MKTKQCYIIILLCLCTWLVTSCQTDYVNTLVIDDLIKLKQNHEEVYLLRNEGHFKIFNFDDGQAFEPDFVLFLKNKNGKNERYQLFIEPKGGHLTETDKWKEDFLKALKERGDVQQINSTVEYILYGLPFYNYSEQTQFAEEIAKITA